MDSFCNREDIDYKYWVEVEIPNMRGENIGQVCAGAPNLVLQSDVEEHGLRNQAG